MPTIPSNEQFVGIASTQDLTERGSSQTNSARTIYTYADFQSGAQSATAVTGVEVSFTENEIYNTSASAGTGNITNDLTGAQLGIVQKLYHEEGSAPTVPAGWVLMGSGTYSTTALNVICRVVWWHES